MQNPRKYGNPPYSVALIHGGPGAAGEMAPVARELSKNTGILEPLQAEMSVAGQIRELKDLLEKNAAIPVTLAGYSWGAWLSLMLAARHPALVKKLILISSGPFEQAYADKIQAVRMKRLKRGEIDEINFLLDAMENPVARNRDKIYSRIGELMSKADVYKPADIEGAKTEINSAIYGKVWKEAEHMRRDGSLLILAKEVKCPVTAIHGDYDPHPAAGVEKPLSGVIADFKFILIKKCGHTPWIEKEAAAEFYRILKREVEPGSQGNLF
jgi:pimeloyl-ACP methyl ester carboxylesterase